MGPGVPAPTPETRTANVAQLFTWAMFAEKCPSDMAFPPLVEADETMVDPEPRFTSAALPSLEALMAELPPFKVTSKTLREADEGRAAWAKSAASTADALKVAPAHTLARDWLGLDTFLAMRTEQVQVVRLKTDADAELARHPGAAASNLALLLGAALYHAWGWTVLVLAPHPHFADSLVEASEALGQLLRDRPARMIGAEHAMLDDLSAREYVHVGRSNSRAVAWRLYD